MKERVAIAENNIKTLFRLVDEIKREQHEGREEMMQRIDTLQVGLNDQIKAMRADLGPLIKLSHEAEGQRKIFSLFERIALLGIGSLIAVFLKKIGWL